MRLDGKTVEPTGAAGGIGLAAARPTASSTRVGIWNR